MTKKIVITPKASQDLDDCFAYIANDNSEIALRFFDSTRLTIAQIARMPGIGGVSIADICSPHQPLIDWWGWVGFV